MKEFFECIGAILVFVLIIVLFFGGLGITVWTICFFFDGDHMTALAELKKDYGIILNPRKMGAIVHRYRWGAIIDGSWDEMTTFFCGVPACFLQFIVEFPEYYSNKDRFREDTVKRYLETNKP